MKNAIVLLLLAGSAAGCSTPRSAAEADVLSPVPRSAAMAEAASAAAAANVLPDASATELQKLASGIRERGIVTLADCFALAEATNEDLLSGDEDRLQAALRRDLALAGIQPTVALSAYAFAQDRIPAGGGGSSSGGGSSFSPSADREQWAITVRQPIFRGFAEFSSIRVADRTRESVEASIVAMRASLRRSVARAFFGVLAAEAEERTLAESERLDRARLDEMRARLELGLARRTEVNLIESRQQVTLASIQRAATGREVAQTILHQIVGLEFGEVLRDDAGPLPAVPGRAEAIAEALRSRAELRAAGLASEAAEASIDVARSGYWPSVAFVGNWYVWRSGVSDFTQSTDWDAQVALDFPFFEGGATRARERTAKSELRKARLAESSTLREIVQDVESVVARASADAALLATFEKSEQLATENLRLLREEYAAGIATNIEVLVAENVLQEAQLEVERQRLVERLDRVELALTLGRTEIER